MKTLKPFNLEAAKAGEPIQTRDGRKARFLAHVPEALPEYRVIILVDGESRSDEFLESGRYNASETRSNDLFMAPKTRTVFVNVYRNGNAWWYESKEYAEHSTDADTLAIAVPVEITE
jgi:hypothetical protein